MTKQVRVNFATLVNASKIRREKRDGRDVIIVPSATLPDNVVMNKIRYGADAIANSFHTLEGTPAPLGHPTVNGKFVSASSPEGIVRGFIGAYNQNVRREGGRVWVDKVIDVAFANQSEGGKAVLKAIEAEKPIHTSTGLLATLRPLTNDADANFEIESMVLDHDCLLLDQPGAATPEQGVGMFVNSEGEQLEVINSVLDCADAAEFETLLRGSDQKERESLITRIINGIVKAVQGDPTPDATEGIALNTKEVLMDQAQFDALSAKVTELSEAVAAFPTTISEVVANTFKPFADAQAARDAEAKATADAEHAALVNKAVEAKLLTEELAKETPAAVLNSLLANAPRAAHRISNAFGGTSSGPIILEPKE